MVAKANALPGDGKNSSPAAIDAVANATGAALQADSARALAALRGVPQGEFVGADLAFRSAMLERFGDDATEDVPAVLIEPAVTEPTVTESAVTESAITESFARAILMTYRSYWRAALARPGTRTDEEAKLFGALRSLIAGQDIADFDTMEPLVTERLRLAGYHSLQGLTGPLRELMLWSRQDIREYRVALPGGEHTTRVFVLDGFASLGWGDYATCGRRGTGGWATVDALYAVVPRYASLDGEEFQVSFLGHETQHFADLARFPGTPQWELEYRAKLVELSQASKTRTKVLRKLSEDQGDDVASPHAYANKRLLAALARRLHLPEGADLEQVDVARLQTEAAAELMEDTRRRRATRPVKAAQVREGPADQ